jgi:nucleoside 2-deoxyribosyltransferase
MKFYLASSFNLIEKVKITAEFLKERGHIITIEWWKYDYKKLDLSDKEWYKDNRVTNISSRNFGGIREAEVFILVADSEKSKKFTGANIELGYAIALGKACYSIGLLERSAMYVPVEQYNSIEQVLSRVESQCK